VPITKLSVQQSIDQMYSIPKSTPKPVSSDLDTIVPLSVDTASSQATGIRSYSNAPPSFITPPVDQLLAYEYRPNLPIYSDQSKLDISDQSQPGLRPQSQLLPPSTPLTPHTMSIASTSGQSQELSASTNVSMFKFPESGADLHDVFGPPLVNRQLKPKKSDTQTNRNSSWSDPTNQSSQTLTNK
jgi:hypothetical protein